MESFVSALDKDGDGEIGQEEAKKVSSENEMLSPLSPAYQPISEFAASFRVVGTRDWLNSLLFFSQLWATVMEQEAAFEGEQTMDGDEPPAEDVSMADLVLDHNLDMPFSYGGSTISSAELSVSLRLASSTGHSCARS